MASFAANLDSFCTNPEILGEKRGKCGRVGEWAIWVGAALLSVFVRRMPLAKGYEFFVPK